jgi:hypothetical protein
LVIGAILDLLGICAASIWRRAAPRALRFLLFYCRRALAVDLSARISAHFRRNVAVSSERFPKSDSRFSDKKRAGQKACTRGRKDLMRNLFIGTGLVGLMLSLGGCSNPLGEPIWSNWDSGQKPVTAYDTESAATPTGAITGRPSYDGGYKPIQTDGRAPQGAVETAPLSPPPGSSLSPAGSGPRADLPPDPYQSRLIQRTRPLALSGLGSSAVGSGAQAVAQTTVTQRTLPLVIAGKGTDRGASRD